MAKFPKPPKKRTGVPALPKKSKAKAAKPPEPKGPVAQSSTIIPADRGGGEARLYDAWKAGLPDVVEPPPEKVLAECQWWLVHFPSRRCVAVNGDRLEGLRHLKKLGRGEDEVGLLPSRPPARAGGRERGREAGKTAGEVLDEASKTEPKEPPKPPEFTPVPEDMDFDRAMKYVFPNARITMEIEKLLVAEDEVFDREGVSVGRKAAWMVRKEAVKLMIEHAQGRAGEKPPPPPDKKKVSYEELERMILGSKATRLVLKNLIEKAEAVPVAAVPVVPSTAKESLTVQSEPAEEGKA